MKTVLKLALLQLCLPMMFAQSADFFTTPTKTIALNAAEIENKIDQAILNPEGILKRFQPTGAEISNKRIVGTAIDFNAKKKIGPIFKNVYVNGVLSTERTSNKCFDGEIAYAAKMDFSKSQDTLSDNIESLQMSVCVSLKSDSLAVVRIDTKIFKGYKFGRLVGTVAKEIVEAQIDPIVAALKAEVSAAK
jgi:hypothetical protein